MQGQPATHPATGASRSAPARAWQWHGPEAEFLPAALEIVERPVSPMPRLIGGTIIAFFVIALAWSWLGKVDVIATAPGKIIPSGRVKSIQPLEIGTIKAIHVEDGQQVAAGDLLIELDPTTVQSDRDRYAADLVRARIEAARLNAQLGRSNGDPFAALGDVDATLVALARDHMLAQEGEQQAKLAAIDRQLAEKRAEQEAVKASIVKLEQSLPLIEQRSEIRRKGVETGFGNKIALLEAQQVLAEQRNELQVQQHHLAQTAEAIEALTHEREHAEAEYRHNLFADLTKAETQIAELTQDLRKATKMTSLQRLTAPVAGVVQQLAVHTIGGVVTPAQQLMILVPSDTRLEVEAMIENKDIGFVAAGQPAEIKVETFNFTRYGLLHGTVTRVSRDAVPTDKPLQPQPGSTEPSMASAETQAPQHLAYVARIALDQTTMRIGSRDVPLEPGMAVTVEIKTDERRVLDYLISPLRTYQHDGLRER